MADIKVDIPQIRGQFDRLRDRMLSEGGGEVTQVDIDRLAHGYASRGMSYAAFAARKIFQLAKLVDRDDDGVVLREDLDAAWSAVEDDVNTVSDGFRDAFGELGPGELGQLGAVFRPLVSALVEMARAEAFVSKPDRMRPFKLGFDRLREILTKAAGEDGILQKVELDGIVTTLTEAGEHVAALAVENVGHYHRFFARGDGIDAKLASLEGFVSPRIEAALVNGQGDQLTATWLAIWRLGRFLEEGISDTFVPEAATSPHDAFRGADRVEQSLQHLEMAVGTRAAQVREGVPSDVRANLERQLMRPGRGSYLSELKREGWTVATSFQTIQVPDETGSPRDVGYVATFASKRTVGGEKASKTVRHFIEPAMKLRRGFLLRDEENDADSYFAEAELYEHVGERSDLQDPQILTDLEVQAIVRDDPKAPRSMALSLAREFLLDNILAYRRDDTTDLVQSVPAERGSESFNFGRPGYNVYLIGDGWDPEDFGKRRIVVRWIDIDDASYTLYFRVNERGDNSFREGLREGAVVLDRFAFDN